MLNIPQINYKENPALKRPNSANESKTNKHGFIWHNNFPTLEAHLHLMCVKLSTKPSELYQN